MNNEKLIVIQAVLGGEVNICEINARETPKRYIVEGDSPLGFGSWVPKSKLNILQLQYNRPKLIYKGTREGAIKFWNTSMDFLRNQEIKRHQNELSTIDNYVIK